MLRLSPQSITGPLLYTHLGKLKTLRSEGTEQQVNVTFECSLSGTGLKRSDVPGFNNFRAESYSGSINKTTFGSVNVPAGINAVCFNATGALLVRASSPGKLLVIPPRSATFVRGPARLVVQAARGDHEVQLVSWQGVLTPLLDSWALARASTRHAQTHRSIACKPIFPGLSGAYGRFEAALKSQETAEPLVLAVMHEVVAKLMMGSDEVQLAAIPSDLPETINELTKRVRERPAQPWPLKDAADAAGYSPFHFSRVFKALVGYGFHEYVDRRRTEVAIDLLCNSDNPVDLVASTSGFGTTQGLRESIKEYLGLVPSELRAASDPVEAGID